MQYETNKTKHMRITLTFSPTEIPFKNSSQNTHSIGLVHNLLGEDNPYHDKFSNYSLSMLRGGVRVEDGITYPNGGQLFISSPDMEIINKICMSLIYGKEFKLRDMKLESWTVEDIKVHSDYDIIHTLSPILLKDEGKRITFEDANFIERLNIQSLAKLQKNGLTPKELKGFVIKPFHFEKAKVERPKIRNVVNPSSKVMLVVEGTPTARKMLYGMGLGNSTGCGFGAVKVRM